MARYNFKKTETHAKQIQMMTVFLAQLILTKVDDAINSVAEDEPTEDVDGENSVRAVYIAMHAAKHEERLENLHDIKLLDKFIRDFLKVCFKIV